MSPAPAVPRHPFVTLNEHGLPDVTGLTHDIIVGPDGEPMLDRWHLGYTPAYSVRIHRWTGPDHQGALHDHCWPNTTIVIAGHLLEHTPEGTRELNPGAIVVRDARTPHSMELLSEDAWTLFTIGPIERQWGFHTSTGWVNSKRWLGTGRTITPDRVELDQHAELDDHRADGELVSRKW